MQSPRVEEVSDGVYAYIQPDGSWYINNTGFLVGGGGGISIDACATQQRTRRLLEAIGSVTPLPVRTLINTHHHGDHTYGNYLFGGATIVAHERCREGVLGYLRFVLDVARRGMAAGLSPLDAARQADLGGYAGLLDSERIVGNLHRAYAELAGAPRGAEIDLIAALTDMISYNGGRPLTCHA
jgi:glyoxylase-like metal-dependent hydrolase (beta-lactamase superfamily II)